MKKQYVTREELLEIFRKKIEGRKAADVAREIGCVPQNVTNAKWGYLSPKILEWLGYAKVEGLYERKTTTEPV